VDKPSMVETAELVARAGFKQIVTLGRPCRVAVGDEVLRGGGARTTHPVPGLPGFEVVGLASNGAASRWLKDLPHPTMLLLKAVGDLNAVLGLADIYDKVRVCRCG
jgi:hypothetical protein